MTSKFDRKDIRVLRVSCEHSLEGVFRVHLAEKDWSALCDAFDSVQRDNVDLSQELDRLADLMANEHVTSVRAQADRATAIQERDEALRQVEQYKKAFLLAKDALESDAEEMRRRGVTYDAVRSVLNDYEDGEISFGKLMELLRAAVRLMTQEHISTGVK
jgi:DNA repair ATPase RecN